MTEKAEAHKIATADNKYFDAKNVNDISVKGDIEAAASWVPTPEWVRRDEYFYG